MMKRGFRIPCSKRNDTKLALEAEHDIAVQDTQPKLAIDPVKKITSQKASFFPFIHMHIELSMKEIMPIKKMRGWVNLSTLLSPACGSSGPCYSCNTSAENI